jgi:hypothetical protein
LSSFCCALRSWRAAAGFSSHCKRAATLHCKYQIHFTSSNFQKIFIVPSPKRGRLNHFAPPLT